MRLETHFQDTTNFTNNCDTPGFYPPRKRNELRYLLPHLEKQNMRTKNLLLKDRAE